MKSGQNSESANTFDLYPIMNIRRNILLNLILFNFLFLSYSQPLKEKIEAVLTDKFFESSILAADIYDLTASKYLYRNNSKLLLHPASNMKVLTSIAGLLFLGTDYQFLTSLYYDGEIISDTLYGNLYIEGGCDPELRSENLMSFISSLKSLNISYIQGSIYADLSFKDSLYWGVGWMWDDDPSTDAPYMSALNINNNVVTVTLTGGNVGQQANVFLNPSSDFFSVNNKSVTVFKRDEENFFITRNWFNRNNEIIVTGTVSLEKETPAKGDKSVNVINPEMLFLSLFKELLTNNGFLVKGEIGIRRLPVLNKYVGSIPTTLMNVLNNVNKNSNNLSAEMVLYALAEKFYGRPAKATNGIKIINELIRLVGHNPEKYRIVDGSGVSHYNLVSAELLCDVLKYIYTNEKKVYLSFYETLPIAGIDGTISQRMMNTTANFNVRAKTGTLSGVSALSGYVSSANGNQIVFSILIQNHVGQTAKAREIQDEICRIISEHK